MAIISRKNRDGSITYQVKLRDSVGKWFQTPGFKNYDEALKEEARLYELRRKGARAFSDDAKTVTLNEFWDVWSLENRSDVSDGWKISQNQMYRDYVKPILGDFKMIDIRAPEIGRALNRAKDMGLGDQTRKHIYSLLRKMFNDAVEYYEMIAASPVKPKFHRPKISERKRDFLMPKQAWRLLEVAKDDYLGPAVWLQVLAGLRPSEVQALQGKSLLFELNQILICAAYNNKTRKLQDYPKQEEWDYSPMPPQLKTYLLSLKRRPDEFVATGPNGGMLSYQTYLPSLRRLCRRAGVPVVTPHELRHTCTEIYVQAGASAEDIRRLLNQHSLTATKAYIHRTDERLSNIASGISEMFPKMFPNGNKETFIADQEETTNVH